MTVTVRDLSIRYGSIVAVDGVSVEFPSGAVGLLGRNGAGKSSILKSLLGLVVPTSGSMQVLDLPIDGSPIAVRQVVGYMPEREVHIPQLNGFETVRLAARLSGLSPRLAARRAHEVLYFAGLDEQRYRPVSGYSAGMKQKVKLATALAHDPKILFLDEPTNGLDPKARREMLRLITELSEEFGKSVILSSHILSDVEEVCDHVVLMEQGKVLASKSVAELTRHETRMVHVGITGEATASRAALEQLAGCPVEEESPGRFLVTVPNDLSSVRIFAAIRDGGAQVREFREHRRSLEEVFVDAVRTSGGDNGP